MASGLTPTYLLPYPIQTDPVDVASDARDLAVAVDLAFLLKAPLNSPEFTGVPVAPTASSDTNTTQIATTGFVINQGYLKASTATATYSPIASPTFTGTPTAPTAVDGTNTTQIATTAFTTTALSNHTSATSGVHGVDGNIVGTSSIQTLTNKTIDGTQNTFQNIPQSAVVGLSGAYSPLNLTINSQNTNYTITASDTARQIEMNSSSANTLYVPTDASVTLPIGTTIIIAQVGTGQTTIAPVTPGTTTINGTPGLKLRTQWSTATLVKRAANVWLAFGDLTA